MICKRCGKQMVQKQPDRIYPSNPPQWDVVWWCGCGYTENGGRQRGKTQDEIMRDEWERINGGWDDKGRSEESNRKE
jgi:hypothetical protein